jgi:hypothetical protein
MGLFGSIKNFTLGDEIRAFDKINGDKGAVTLTVRDKNGAKRLCLSAKSQSDTTMVLLNEEQVRALIMQFGEVEKLMKN